MFCSLESAALPDNVSVLPLDVTDFSRHEHVFQKAVQQFGKVSNVIFTTVFKRNFMNLRKRIIIVLLFVNLLFYHCVISSSFVKIILRD